MLAPELPLSELLAQQTYQRAQALERLARLVDRPCVEVPVTREQLDREVELAERHPLQRLRQGLAGQLREAALAPQRSLGRAAGALGLREGDADPYGDGRHERCGERRHNGAVSDLPPAAWWTVRRAANRKPATYRCPICGHHLPALSEHMLIAPEGDTRRRRHAHTECVLAARARGELLLREEWLRTQPRPPSLWRRLLRRG